MSGIYTSVDQLIGGTPLLELVRIQQQEGLRARILAKLEHLNPGGSAKDRVGRALIDDAEARGLLRPGSVIIEPTSGNTGIGLACVAAARGYRTVIVMPDSMSVERRKLMGAYGAEVVLTPGAQGMQGAIQRAEELAREIPGSFIPGQFDNPANPAAHRASTGPEIWRDTGGQVDRHGPISEGAEGRCGDRSRGARRLPGAQRRERRPPWPPGDRGGLRPPGAGHRDL